MSDAEREYPEGAACRIEDGVLVNCETSTFERYARFLRTVHDKVTGDED